MKLRMCRCCQCKAALDSKSGSFTVTYYKRAARHLTKQLIKTGQFDKIPVAVSIPYLG